MAYPQILFLTPRRWALKDLHRVVLSKLIAFFSGKYVHCALIYKKHNINYVREMDFNGVRHYTLTEYYNKHHDRIVFLSLKKLDYLNDNLLYNKWCLKSKAEYDYRNLLGWQLFKAVFGFWIGYNSKAKRTCSEDCARGINKVKLLFRHADMYTPTELYTILKHYV